MKNQELKSALNNLVAVLQRDDANFEVDGDMVLTTIPETTGINPYLADNVLRPYGPVTTLAEMRAKFPNIAVLPNMESSVARLNANGTVEISVPDKVQFVMVTSSSYALMSFNRRPNAALAAGEVEEGIYMVTQIPLIIYTPTVNRICFRDVSGANSYVSVMYYQTGKMVTV